MNKHLLCTILLTGLANSSIIPMQKGTNPNNNACANEEPQLLQGTPRKRSLAPCPDQNSTAQDGAQESPLKKQRNDTEIATQLTQEELLIQNLTTAPLDVQSTISKNLPSFTWFLNFNKEIVQDVVSASPIKDKPFASLLPNSPQLADNTACIATTTNHDLIAFVSKQSLNRICIFNNKTNEQVFCHAPQLRSITQMKFIDDTHLLVLGLQLYIPKPSLQILNITNLKEMIWEQTQVSTNLDKLGGIQTNTCSVILLDRSSFSVMNYQTGDKQHSGQLRWFTKGTEYIFADFLGDTRNTIITVSTDSTIRFWNQEESCAFKIWTSPDKNNVYFPHKVNTTPMAAALSADKRFLAVVCAAIQERTETPLAYKHETHILDCADVCIIDLHTKKQIHHFTIHNDRSYCTQTRLENLIECSFITNDSLVIKLPHQLSAWVFETSAPAFKLYDNELSHLHEMHYNTMSDSLLTSRYHKTAKVITGINNLISQLKKTFGRQTISIEQALFFELLLKKVELQTRFPSHSERTTKEQQDFTTWTRLLFQWLKQRQLYLGFSNNNENHIKSLIIRPESQE